MMFSEKLKKLRKENNLTQEELADKLNISRQAITKWETTNAIPDIDNLKELSILFNVSIDELVRDDKDVKINIINKYSYLKEIEIDHIKHFDIVTSKVNEVNIISIKDELVKVELLSNEESMLDEIFTIKVDELYNRIDIDIKGKSISKDIIVNISIPEKYIEEIELNSKTRTLNITDIDIKKLEFDGVLKYLNVVNSRGKVVLNASKCDIEADYSIFEGSLEINSFNSVSRVKLPGNSIYKTIVKGKKNIIENDNLSMESKNIIELNGFNSKLIIINK